MSRLRVMSALALARPSQRLGGLSPSQATLAGATLLGGVAAASWAAFARVSRWGLGTGRGLWGRRRSGRFMHGGRFTEIETLTTRLGKATRCNIMEV